MLNSLDSYAKYVAKFDHKYRRTFDIPGQVRVKKITYSYVNNLLYGLFVNIKPQALA